jgi:hypothetical protein
LVIALLATSFATSVARADATFAETFQVQAMGAMAHLSAEGAVTTLVADRRWRIDNRVIRQSESMAQYQGAWSGTTLVLLEERKLLRLNSGTGDIEQLGFDELRGRLDYGRDAIDAASTGAEMVDLPVREEDCQWSLPESEARATGAIAEIGGVEAEQHYFNWRQSCVVPESRQVCELSWNLERWTARRVPGGDELQSVEQAFFNAMGGVDLLSAAELNDSGLLALFPHGWVQLLAEARELPGFPVKTVMSLEIGGVDCTTVGGTPLAYDSDWVVMEQIAKDTARRSTVNAASNTVADTVMRSVDLGGWGGLIAGTAASELTRRAIDRMTQRKEEEAAVPPEELHEVDPDADAVMLFRITTELVAASRERVGDEVFEIPTPVQGN